MNEISAASVVLVWPNPGPSFARRVGALARMGVVDISRHDVSAFAACNHWMRRHAMREGSVSV
jgi:hypothetical protein